MTGSVVAGTPLEDTTSRGLTQALLATTGSYQARNFTGIKLGANDLTGWDFSRRILSSASFSTSTLTNVNLTGSLVAGASFHDTTSRGFTQAQLASTASYQAKNLSGILLAYNNLTGWDFNGQNLTGADLSFSTFTNAYLAGASLENAYLDNTLELETAIFTATSVYNQWTVFPAGFNPGAAGLTLMVSPVGDLDADNMLNTADIDLLASKINLRPILTSWLPDAAFDLNRDGTVDSADHRTWVKDLKRTWFGDANLDGQFNTADLVTVFQAGQYETGIATNSTWSIGDWNADGQFTSDLVSAFQDGRYEQGPRGGVHAVPEPFSLATLVSGLLVVWKRKLLHGNTIARG
jgi:uncharacterized protein YjbI with pentapeptide repeats